MTPSGEFGAVGKIFLPSGLSPPHEQFLQHRIGSARTYLTPDVRFSASAEAADVMRVDEKGILPLSTPKKNPKQGFCGS